MLLKEHELGKRLGPDPSARFWRDRGRPCLRLGPGGRVPQPLAASPGSLPSPAGSRRPRLSGAAPQAPSAPAPPSGPASAAADGIRGPAVPNMAALATPRPPGSLPPPRASPRPTTPPRRRAACCDHASATPPSNSDRTRHAHLAQLRLRAWSISGGRDVTDDSNQYRKPDTTRCQGQPRPEKAEAAR